MEERFIVQTSTPERLFVKVYHDFLNSGKLSGKEQIIFIHLKQYINFAEDKGTVKGNVYPTLATLAKNVKMTEKTVREVLHSLRDKGILEIKRQGLNKPNIYKINDSADMWTAGSMEELKAAVDEIEEKRMIELLTAKGYYISKEKEPVSEPAKSHSQALSENTFDTSKDITLDAKSQALERYSMSDIHTHYHYNELIADYPKHRADFDIVFDIIFDTLNSTKKTIRVGGEERPSERVKEKLLRLDNYDILYTIETFHQQHGKIEAVKPYLLTMLFNAREQAYLSLMNLGHVNGDF